MHIAFVGCGYVADFYTVSLKNYPELELTGVFDINEERALNFAKRYNVSVYPSFAALLADTNVEIIVNLTNPQQHYTVTKACLEAGKHVYSEKPLATTLPEARQLSELATGPTKLAVAPSTLLGDTAQTVWKLLTENAIGTVYLAYAELDDGAIYQMNYRNWISASGIQWPYIDEFENGSSMEHANYQLSWLTAFFGPAQQITCFSSCLVPDKLGSEHTGVLGDDFSVTSLQFASGTIARLTCSTLAPENHSLTLIGSEGIITVEDCWLVESPVYLQKRYRDVHTMPAKRYVTDKQRVELYRPYNAKKRVTYQNTHDLDPARGIADLAEAIAHQCRPRLSAEQAVHIQEIVTKITQASTFSEACTTSFPPPAPVF